MKKWLLLLLVSTLLFADTPPPVDGLKLKYGTQSGLVNASNGSPSVLGCGSNTGYVPTWTGTVFNCQALPASGVSSVSGTAPIQSSGGTTPVISCIAATGSVAGCLSAADWTTFNGKQDALGFTAVPATRTISTTAPIAGGGDLSANRTLTCITATGSVAGCLSATDWTTFNGKQDSLSFSAPLVNTTGTVSCTSATGSVNGCLSSTDWTTFNGKVATTRSISTTAPIQGGGDLSANRTLTCDVASGSQPGCLASADWTTFNGKVSTSRSISTTAPLQGGGDLSANRTLTCDVASGSQPGCLASADWATFNNKQATGLTVLKAGDTMTGTLIDSFSGTASNSALLMSGTPFTGGSATTTKPLVNIETAGVVSNNWSTSGTTLGINGPTGFAGRLIDTQVNGVDVAWITSGGLFVSQSGTERIECGMTSSTRYSCNQAAHAGELFFQYAANSGAQQWGYGTFNNNYTFSFNSGGTATYSAANVVGNFTTPQINIRNSNNTANNFGDINFSGASDNPVAWIAGTTVTQTTSSEDGRLTFGTTSAGTRADKLKIEMKGQMTHGGTAPTLTCGTGATVAGNDNVGRVTVGTAPGTSCTITFAATWANAPHCDATDETAAAGVGVTVPCVATTTAAVCTYASLTASDKLSFSCRGFF